MKAFNKPLDNKKYAWVIGGLCLVMLLLSAVIANLPILISLGVIVFCLIAVFILKKPHLGIVLIAFFLPFERLGAYEFGDVTVRISQILLILTLGIWLLRAVWRRQFSLAKNPLIFLLIVFLLINFIALPNSLNLNRSLIVLSFIVFTMLLAWLLPNIIVRKDQVRQAVIALLIGFVLVSGFGILQFLGDMSGLPPEVTGLRELYTKDILGFTRVQSTAYEPLYFANYLLIPISILLALFLAGHRIVKSSWLIILVALGLVNIVLTVSRGGYLAIFISVLIVGIFYARRMFTFKNIAFFSIGLIAVGWVAISALGVGGELLTKEKFQGHILNSFYGASYDERVETFDNAVTVWRDYPMVGVSPGGFGPYLANHPSYVPKDGWRIVNNEYLEILAENGIIGLGVFLLFIAFLIIRSLKAIRQAQDKYLRAIQVGLLAAFMGALAQYLTFSTLYIMHIWFLVGLLIAVQNIIFNSSDKETAIKKLSRENL